MGGCYATLEQMGMLDGSRREGFITGQTFISYFQMESLLLEYPKVCEAGVLAQCDSGRNQTLRIYLALDEDFSSDDELKNYCQDVANFIRKEFALECSIQVQIRDKLPMTRSGKLLRKVLQEWN